MGSLAAWLLAAVGPLAIRVLAALGITWLTYEGLDTVAGVLRDTVLSYMGSLPAAGLGLASLAGLTDAVGIALGAIAARVALVSAQGFWGRVQSS